MTNEHKDEQTDERRARAIAWDCFSVMYKGKRIASYYTLDTWWEQLSLDAKSGYLCSSRAIRASDKEAGMVLVPRVASETTLEKGIYAPLPHREQTQLAMRGPRREEMLDEMQSSWDAMIAEAAKEGKAADMVSVNLKPSQRTKTHD